jgi:hypothetical protein
VYASVHSPCLILGLLERWFIRGFSVFMCFRHSIDAVDTSAHLICDSLLLRLPCEGRKKELAEDWKEVDACCRGFHCNHETMVCGLVT